MYQLLLDKLETWLNWKIITWRAWYRARSSGLKTSRKSQRRLHSVTRPSHSPFYDPRRSKSHLNVNSLNKRRSLFKISRCSVFILRKDRCCIRRLCNALPMILPNRKHPSLLQTLTYQTNCSKGTAREVMRMMWSVAPRFNYIFLFTFNSIRL